MMIFGPADTKVRTVPLMRLAKLPLMITPPCIYWHYLCIHSCVVCIACPLKRMAAQRRGDSSGHERGNETVLLRGLGDRMQHATD